MFVVEPFRFFWDYLFSLSCLNNNVWSNIVILIIKNYFLFCYSIETEFGVEVCAIGVNFMEGPSVFPTIWERIKDKEIGILGTNVYMYMYIHLPSLMYFDLVINV